MAPDITNTWNSPEWWSLVAFVMSGAIALYIAMPSLHKLAADYDLVQAHGRLVTVAWCLMILWGFSWTLAVVLAGVGLLT